MAPLCFVSEAFGLIVTWDNVTNTINIMTKLPEVNAGAPLKSLITRSFEWDEYYTRVTVENNLKGLEYGELIMFDGTIANVGQNNTNVGEAGADYILVNGAETTWAVYIYNNRFNELYIGDTVRVYGIYMGRDETLGHMSMSLLRDVMGEDVTNQRLAGFDVAYIYEGETLANARDIENFLNQRLQDYDTNGVGFFTFKVKEVGDNCFNIAVGLNEEHSLGKVLRIEDLTDKQRDDVYSILKSRMLVLATALDSKCPDFIFSGHYEDYFETDEGYYRMRYASWTNGENAEPSYYVDDTEGEGNIHWLKKEDYDWIFESTEEYFEEDEEIW
jgi:hypothetical protein